MNDTDHIISNKKRLALSCESNPNVASVEVVWNKLCIILKQNYGEGFQVGRRVESNDDDDDDDDDDGNDVDDDDDEYSNHNANTSATAAVEKNHSNDTSNAYKKQCLRRGNSPATLTF